MARNELGRRGMRSLAGSPVAALAFLGVSAVADPPRGPGFGSAPAQEAPGGLYFAARITSSIRGSFVQRRGRAESSVPLPGRAENYHGLGHLVRAANESLRRFYGRKITAAAGVR